MYVALHDTNECAHLDVILAVMWLGMATWLG